MLTRWIQKESYAEGEYERLLQDIKNGLGFSPLTGQIVVLGVYDVEKEQGVVYFQAPGEQIDDFTEGNIKFRQATEAQMLELFWKGAEQYSEFISFNGRAFDVPFMMIRSAICGVKPTKNLMSNRYSGYQAMDAKHTDLLDQLSFYGALKRKGSLHLWCRAFGIKSPKADGVTGDDVALLFREREFLQIARYNVGDLLATKALYDVYKNYFLFK